MIRCLNVLNRRDVESAEVFSIRHCEEAKPTRQSSAVLAALDCFAALAMTFAFHPIEQDRMIRYKQCIITYKSKDV